MRHLVRTAPQKARPKRRMRSLQKSTPSCSCRCWARRATCSTFDSDPIASSGIAFRSWPGPTFSHACCAESAPRARCLPLLRTGPTSPKSCSRCWWLHREMRRSSGTCCAVPARAPSAEWRDMAKIIAGTYAVDDPGKLGARDFCPDTDRSVFVRGRSSSNNTLLERAWARGRASATEGAVSLPCHSVAL
jgi:hypothetical protein